MVRLFKGGLLYLTFSLLLPILCLWPGISFGEGIAIGVVLPLSGTHTALGHMQKNSMLMAAERINAGNGIKGRSLELDIRDSAGDPRTARAIVDHFVKDKQYPVVLGGLVSSVAAALADKCEQRRIPLLVVSGSEDAITLQDYRFVFRVAPPRSRYPASVMDFARSVIRPGKVVLITDRSAYGDAMNRVTRQVARDAGWDVVGQWQFTTGDRNLDRVYAQTADLKPDAVFLAAFPPYGTGMVARLRQEVPDARLFNLVPASIMAGSYEECGPPCDGVMNPSLWLPERDSMSDSYRNSYNARYGRFPDYHGAEAYASVMAAAQAIGRAGSVQAESVRNALAGVAVSTPYGRVTFRSWGGYFNQNDPPNYLVRWTGGEFELVWPGGR